METLQEQKLTISKNRVYEIAVVSTMSSGKSTLVNALIGLELLPAQNSACTGRVTSILDSDGADCAKAHLLYRDGTFKTITQQVAQELSDILRTADDDVSDVVVECDIGGIRNIKRSALIVDTPGVNNSEDRRHAEITERYLASIESGTIVYVINATAMGTNDDAAFLTKLHTLIEHNNALQVIFVMNKADEFDPDTEPLDRAVSNCAQYLRSKGFASPLILPVSSIAALLIKKVIAHEKLTKAEIGRFTICFDQFRSQDHRLSAFAMIPGEADPSETYTVGRKQYMFRELTSALENTGFPLLERTLETQMTESLRRSAPKITASYKKNKAKEKKKS